MIRFVLLLSLLYVLNVSYAQKTYPLLRLDIEERDSFLRCETVKQYKEMERYMKNFMDRSLEPELRSAARNSLYRLFYNKKKPYKDAVIVDRSLDTASYSSGSSSYKLDDYLSKVNEFVSMFNQYKKFYIAHGCLNPKSQTNDYEVISPENDRVQYPILHFGFDYIDSSFLEVVNTTLFNKKYKNYEVFASYKKMSGSFQKTVIPEDFEEYKEEYGNLQKRYNELQRKEIRDSFSTQGIKLLEEKENLLEKIVKLESSFIEIQFNIDYITEDMSVNMKKMLKSLNEEGKSCACGYPPPIDSDGDMYSELVDCNDKDPTVYPGAPRNPNNNWDDDNCDGQSDETEPICNDLDGDNYFEGPDCDCDKNIKSKNVLKKCDCNDNDPTVHPGAFVINPNNNWDDDNCNGVKDCSGLTPVNPIVLDEWDYTYPPVGLIKFGRREKPSLRAQIYTGSMLVTGGMAAYFKITSNRYYTDYLQNTTLRQQDVLYDKANQYHKAFVVSTASTLLVYVATQIDLAIEFKNYKKKLEKTKSEIQKGPCLEEELLGIRFSPFSFQSMTPGPSLTFTF